MKLLIEEYQYNVADVEQILEGLFTLQDVEQRISVSYVGYFYNPKIQDVVFILPKVLIDEKGLVFGKYNPVDVIHLDETELEPHELKFIYEFAVWVHRAIVVFNDTHDKNEIVLHKQIESTGHGGKKKKSNTLLDIILSLIRFNKENQQFFTFILKNMHSGFNKINWQKTISNTRAVVQEESPIYLRPVNKKRQVNFDEELIIIYFSILKYIADTYGFKVNINFGFKLLSGSQFKRYLDGYGRILLKQIKYKYFSDVAVRLWDLCYAFFDKTYQINVNADQSEYLLVKSFHIVFEAMIDELIGVPHDQIPAGLADQYDGKIVDHFYTYESLLINNRPDEDIYYIGDSKYYKMGSELGTESTYKQRTYARNVIQWNLDIHAGVKPNPGKPYGTIELFDSVTEGYNVIPNFFISARIDKETLTYDDYLELHEKKPDISRHFKNRLYDRDTLLLSHYDVNFLFVLALYARNNSASKGVWRESVRAKFRTEVQRMLKEKFDFYALAAHPDVDAEAYFKGHFQDTLGKTFRPFENQQIFSLALDNEFPDDNEKLLASLGENFYVVPCELGTDPSDSIQVERATKGVVKSPAGMGKFLTAMVTGDDSQLQRFLNHTADKYTMRKIPAINFMEVEYLLPMVQGEIDGYYKVERLSFGERTDKETGEKRPCLNFMLGEYIPLGDHRVHIYRGKMQPGELLPYTYVLDLYEGRI